MGKARDIHKQVEQARELEQELLKSLKLSDEALLEYEKEKDLKGMAEILSSRALTFRHLGRRTGEQAYLLIAREEMTAAIKVAEKSGDETALAIPWFNLAKVDEDLGNIKKAVEAYSKAVDYMSKAPPVEHDREAVLYDFKAHLATVELKNGDVTAEQRAVDAAEMIMGSNETAYNRDVWASGTYMRLASILKENRREKAEEYLQKAGEIIDDNPELKLRKEQWDKLKAEF